jgi:hypothetical protein
MVYIAKLLISGRQKIAMTMLLAAMAVFLAYYPRITESLLAFCLGGEVPGTNIILSPTVVLTMVAGIFIAGILAFCVRMYFRAARGSRNFVQIPVTAVSTTTMLKVSKDETMEDKSSDVPAVRTSMPLQRRHRLSMIFAGIARSIIHLAYVFGLRIRGAIRILGHGANASLKTFGKSIYKITRSVLIAIDTILGIIWIGIHAAFMMIRRIASRTASFAATTAGWLKPRFVRFDAWLEIQVRKLEARAKKKANQHETVRVLATMGREYRQSMHELKPQAALQASRQKIVRLKTKITTAPQR